MKRIYVLLAACCMMLISSCAPAIVYNAARPDMAVPEKSAMLYIVRPEAEKGVLYNANKMGAIYIDGAFSGLTLANTMVCIPAKLGTHYIIAKVDNVSVIKLSFSAGKKYYLIQKTKPVPISAPSPGFGRPTGGLTRVDTKLELLSDTAFATFIQENKQSLRFVSVDKRSTFRDLTFKEKRENINRYEYWAKGNPERAMKHYEYFGY